MKKDLKLILKWTTIFFWGSAAVVLLEVGIMSSPTEFFIGILAYPAIVLAEFMAFVIAFIVFIFGYRNFENKILFSFLLWLSVSALLKYFYFFLNQGYYPAPDVFGINAILLLIVLASAFAIGILKKQAINLNFSKKNILNFALIFTLIFSSSVFAKNYVYDRVVGPQIDQAIQKRQEADLIRVLKVAYSAHKLPAIIYNWPTSDNENKERDNYFLMMPWGEVKAKINKVDSSKIYKPAETKNDNLAKQFGGNSKLTISPDGKKAFYLTDAKYGDNSDKLSSFWKIKIYDIQTGISSSVSSQEFDRTSNISWSPNSNFILFIGTENAMAEESVWLVDTNARILFKILEGDTEKYQKDAPFLVKMFGAAHRDELPFGIPYGYGSLSSVNWYLE